MACVRLLLVEPSPRKRRRIRLPGARRVDPPARATDASTTRLDILNMTEVGEIMRDSGWKPSRTSTCRVSRTGT